MIQNIFITTLLYDLTENEADSVGRRVLLTQNGFTTEMDVNSG